MHMVNICTFIQTGQVSFENVRSEKAFFEKTVACPASSRLSRAITELRGQQRGHACACCHPATALAHRPRSSRRVRRESLK